MGSSRFKIILLHCILPLMAGFIIYISGIENPLSVIIKNYLPDGLWAYAFGTTMLLIWDYRLPWKWLIAGWFILCLTEWLQNSGLMPGTADWLDLLTYTAGYGISISFGQYLNRKSKTLIR